MYVQIIVLGIIGLVLSAYALYVELYKAKHPKYRPLCDINRLVSCTRAFMSPYGRLFYLPNPVYGMIFYVFVIALGVFELEWHLFLLSIVGTIASLFLAYILYFRIRSACIVCTATYVLNILLLIWSWP